MEQTTHADVSIPAGDVSLSGNLALPANAKGVVIFSHGSGSSRFSPRNNQVAEYLQESGFATLLFDLLTTDEDLFAHHRFDIRLLSERLIRATDWVRAHPPTKGLPVAYFGASTGAASALKAAAVFGDIRAVVSRGGRPDLALEDLENVTSPTLLVVGGLDYGVIELNENAYAMLHCTKDLKIVEGATHLFEEPGKMQAVCELAAAWFKLYLY